MNSFAEVLNSTHYTEHLQFSNASGHSSLAELQKLLIHPSSQDLTSSCAGGQNKGVAHLQSFAAIDSAIPSAKRPSQPSVGYDLMGTQVIEEVYSEDTARPVTVPVQDSAESYTEDG